MEEAEAGQYVDIEWLDTEKSSAPVQLRVLLPLDCDLNGVRKCFEERSDLHVHPDQQLRYFTYSPNSAAIEYHQLNSTRLLKHIDLEQVL